MTEDPVTLKCPICRGFFVLDVRDPATHEAAHEALRRQGAAASRQEPDRKGRFFGGECRNCGGEVWVNFEPTEEGRLLCGKCFRESRSGGAQEAAR